MINPEFSPSIGSPLLQKTSIFSSASTWRSLVSSSSSSICRPSASAFLRSASFLACWPSCARWEVADLWPMGNFGGTQDLFWGRIGEKLVWKGTCQTQRGGTWRNHLSEVTRDANWAVFKRSCSSEGAKGTLTRQLTRCLSARSFSLRAGKAYADAYAGLRTPGFCFREVLIAILLLKMNQKGLDVAQLKLQFTR